MNLQEIKETWGINVHDFIELDENKYMLVRSEIEFKRPCSSEDYYAEVFDGQEGDLRVRLLWHPSDEHDVPDVGLSVVRQPDGSWVEHEETSYANYILKQQHRISNSDAPASLEDIQSLLSQLGVPGSPDGPPTGPHPSYKYTEDDEDLGGQYL